MKKLKKIYEMFRDAAMSWIEDYAPSMSAALAFYTMFSLAPLVFIVVLVAGLVFGQEAARGEIFSQLQGLVGEQAAAGVEGMLSSVSNPEVGAVGTLFGSVMLLIGATTVFAELQNSLDRIWRAPARELSGILALVRARLLSFGLILGIGFLLIASLVASAALAALGRWWSPLFGGWSALAQIANTLVSFGLFTLAFAMIYKIMPRVHIAWRDVWVGAAVTALLFSIGKLAIGLYIGRSGIASAYGAAASLAIVLIWVYYSAAIFLLGAEFTWVYAHEFGSRKGMPRKPAAAVPTRASEGVDATGLPLDSPPGEALRPQRAQGALMRTAWWLVALAYVAIAPRTHRRGEPH